MKTAYSRAPFAHVEVARRHHRVRDRRDRRRELHDLRDAVRVLVVVRVVRVLRVQVGVDQREGAARGGEAERAEALAAVIVAVPDALREAAHHDTPRSAQPRRARARARAARCLRAPRRDARRGRARRGVPASIRRRRAPSVQTSWNAIQSSSSAGSRAPIASMRAEPSRLIGHGRPQTLRVARRMRALSRPAAEGRRAPALRRAAACTKRREPQSHCSG